MLEPKLPIQAEIFLILSLYAKMLLVGIILALDAPAELGQASGFRMDLLVVLLLALSSQINRHFLKMDIVVWFCETAITSCLIQTFMIWVSSSVSIIAVTIFIALYAGGKVHRAIKKHRQENNGN